MTTALFNSTVRLTHDIPELWLRRGDAGVVQSVWHSPAECYEVEFRKPGECGVRALLNAELLEVVEPSPGAAVQQGAAMERKRS